MSQLSVTTDQIQNATVQYFSLSLLAPQQISFDDQT